MSLSLILLGQIEASSNRPERPHLTGPASIPVARVLNPVVRPFSLGSEAGIDRDLLEGTSHAQSVGDDVIDGWVGNDKSLTQGSQGTNGGEWAERRLTTWNDVMVENDPPALTVDVVVSLLRLPNRSTYNHPPGNDTYQP